MSVTLATFHFEGSPFRELANGALYVWACDDDFGWQLLSCNELAGHRRFYERLRPPFNGSADKATHHLNVLSTCGGGDGDDGDDSDGGGGELEEDVDDEERERLRQLKLQVEKLRAWLNEQHRMREDELARELRFVSTPTSCT